MNEVWKDIKGYEGLYQISDQGNVFSVKRNKTLRPLINTYGYHFVNLHRDGKQIASQIHRLVAEAFIPNPDNKPQVNHINENKADNRVCNLNWMTNKENMNWGTGKERSHQKQINHPNESKQIIQMDLNNNVIAIWPSMSEAERAGFSKGTIWNCCNGVQKTHKGYKWEYV